jgi:hypothetical protein
MVDAPTSSQAGATPPPPRRLRAVPLTYAGVSFRSTLEADWAATLDALGLTWSYETQGYRLPSGQCYLPDFWIPCRRTWLEVKGPHYERYDKFEEFASTLLHQEIFGGYTSEPPYIPNADEGPAVMDRRNAHLDRHITERLGAPDRHIALLGLSPMGGLATLGPGSQILTCDTCGHYTLSPVDNWITCRVCWQTNAHSVAVPFARAPRGAR